MHSVTHRNTWHRSVGGFTLIELMVVVAVVAILAAIAYPTFIEQIRKSRRAEAVTLINQIAQAQERWRANNPSYTTDLSASGVNVANPNSGYYAASIPAATSSSYTVLATASGAQTADAKCTRLSMVVSGGSFAYSSVGTAASSVCWNR